MRADDLFKGVPRGKVLVAMSGGGDSSVTAALRKDAGFDPVGVFMRLGSPGDTLDELTTPDEPACDPKAIRLGKQGCCSVGDAADARLVSAELGMPFYVVNFRREFGRIIDYFVDEYAKGRTPTPCVRCNDWLKFGRLPEYADQIGADYVATGHYARVDRSGASPVLRRGEDADKDQSYVLFGMRRARLGSLLLPVGDVPDKAGVRELAEHYGLPVADKPDSYEICFVPGNDYAKFVEGRRGELRDTPGDVLDTEGNVVGTHGGHHTLTVGQRRGIGVALGRRIYVVDKDPERNTVTVGARADLATGGCLAREVNWLSDPPALGEPLPCTVQYRAHGAPEPATCTRAEDGLGEHLRIAFDEPVDAVAPGQAAVVYAGGDPSLVLGGGWVASASAPDRAARA